MRTPTRNTACSVFDTFHVANVSFECYQFEVVKICMLYAFSPPFSPPFSQRFALFTLFRFLVDESLRPTCGPDCKHHCLPSGDQSQLGKCVCYSGYKRVGGTCEGTKLMLVYFGDDI